METLTVPLKPPVSESVNLIATVEFGEIEIWPGVAEMEKDDDVGGGEDGLEVPPPQPQIVKSIDRSANNPLARPFGI